MHADSPLPDEVGVATLRIGDVAQRTGVSPRALRYYEEKNLLAAERSASGQRRYGEAAVERVRLIQQLYTAGMDSDTVRTVLVCINSGRATSNIAGVLAAERERIIGAIAELEGARARLDRILDPALGRV